MTYRIGLLTFSEPSSVVSRPFRKSAERTGHGMLIGRRQFRAARLCLFSGASVEITNLGEYGQRRSGEGRP